MKTASWPNSDYDEVSNDNFTDTFDIIYNKLSKKDPKIYPKEYKMTRDVYKLILHLEMYIKSNSQFSSISQSEIESSVIKSIDLIQNTKI